MCTILITAPENRTFARYFPGSLVARLQAFGEVRRNPFGRSFTPEELRERVSDAEILITHWGTPKIDETVLRNAPKLRLVAHAAGSVAGIASEALYDRGIPVLSANPVMAKYVAESVLGYMIAGTHRFLQTDAVLRAGGWDKQEDLQRSLYGAEIGLIGLGAVGRKLLELLSPFGCRVSVYDPYVPEDALAEWDFASLCDFETALMNPIVSVHASQTPETYHLIDAAALSLLPRGALLINAARASITDTAALMYALKENRLYAVLDVYDTEGAGKLDEALLRQTGNTLLQPHAAAVAAGAEMTAAIIDDIGRFLREEEPLLAVSREQFRLMTKER